MEINHLTNNLMEWLAKYNSIKHDSLFNSLTDFDAIAAKKPTAVKIEHIK